MESVTLTQIVLAVQEYKTVHNLKQKVLKSHGEELQILLAAISYLDKTIRTGHTEEFKHESDKQWKIKTIESMKERLAKLEKELSLM